MRLNVTAVTIRPHLVLDMHASSTTRFSLLNPDLVVRLLPRDCGEAFTFGIESTLTFREEKVTRMTPTKKQLGALLLAAITIFSLATLVLVTPPAAHAQADLGSISGVVTDASGAVVPKAAVKVTNIATGAERVSETGSKGDYSVTHLVGGTYKVSISGPGFETAEQNVTVTVGSDNTFSARLAVSGGKTEIVVSTDDFAGVQLEKAEISAVIDTEQIQSLPTLDRNPYSLVAFSGNLSADPTATARGVGFNISGARNTAVDILLDGAENTDLY